MQLPILIFVHTDLHTEGSVCLVKLSMPGFFIGICSLIDHLRTRRESNPICNILLFRKLNRLNYLGNRLGHLFKNLHYNIYSLALVRLLLLTASLCK